MADGNAGRVPAQNLDAEAAVLSAVMIDQTKTALDLARGVLGTGADFYADANRRVWEGILELDAAGKPIDVVTLRELLDTQGRLGQVGGVAYLAQLTDATPAIAHVEAHAAIIADKARQRRLVDAAHRIVSDGYGRIEDVRAWALSAAQTVSDLATSGKQEDPAERFDELMPRVMNQITAWSRSGQQFTGVDTGWMRVNAILGGWERSMLHVIAGRPGMGKTSAVVCACLNVARAGHGVVLLSAEMPKEQLAMRALAVEAHVNLKAVMAGRMNGQEWAAVTAASARLSRMPLVIKFCPGATIAELRATLRKESRRLPELGLAAVDYIQILNGERASGENRESEVAGLSRRLMWMAQEFKVPLLVVSQLNRGVEARNNQNKRPGLSDLRESGAIEQDAYSVSMLYRDEYYNKESELAGVLEWIVAKHRNGPTGIAKLAFLEGSTIVANLADDEQRPLFDDETGPDQRGIASLELAANLEGEPA